MCQFACENFLIKTFCILLIIMEKNSKNEASSSKQIKRRW